MSKSNATRKIRECGEYYTRTKKKIDAIRADKAYTDDFKKSQVDRLISEYNANIGKYQEDANTAIEAIQKGLAEKRQADIEKGLASAEIVNNILNGIKGGVYTGEMMRDLVAIHRDNAYATKAIRGALVASENDEYKSIGIGIPLSNGDKVSHNLDRIIKGIKEIPSPLEVENGRGNFNVGLYQSGQNFDSWCNYIDTNIEE